MADSAGFTFLCQPFVTYSVLLYCLLTNLPLVWQIPCALAPNFGTSHALSPLVSHLISTFHRHHHWIPLPWWTLFCWRIRHPRDGCVSLPHSFFTSCSRTCQPFSIVGDMWEPHDQGFAVAFVVFSSVGGSVIGPVVGGFMQQYLNWHWKYAPLLFRPPRLPKPADPFVMVYAASGSRYE